MIKHIISDALDNPRPFSHSHATLHDNLLITSGMVSRKNDATKLNIGVYHSSSDNNFSHNVSEQFYDIVDQLYSIASSAGLDPSLVKDSLLDVRVFIVDVRQHFQAFNNVYAEWMSDKSSYPSRTTIGVAALPSNVVLEIAFTLSI